MDDSASRATSVSGSWTSSPQHPWNEAPTAGAMDRFGTRDARLVRAEVAVQAVVFVVAVIGNVLVIVALWLQARERQLRRRLTVQAGGPPSSDRDARRFHGHQHHHGRLRLSRMDFMILHLTIADLSVAGFTVLPQLIWDALGQFPGNDVLCRSIAYLQVIDAHCKRFFSTQCYYTVRQSDCITT